MDTPLTSSDASDWSYRGEGAANLVLGYRGSAPFYVGKVLRIQKVPKDRSPHGGGVMSEHERLVWADVAGMGDATSREEVGMAFVREVMAELLGHEHVDVGVKIHVSKEFLLAIENMVADQRPDWRVEASMINTSCDHALLISDHAVFPHAIPECCHCITVEIKPKCGFLPSSEFIAEKNAVKQRITRFRMHQLLKLHKGEVLQVSEYDPVDLFSGARDRINTAVKALFATPQNNLRLFLDGSIIFGALGGILDRADTLGKNLAFEDSVIWSIQGMTLSTFQEVVCEAIWRSGILNLLLEAQKLDKIDVEGAIHAYYDIVSQPCLVCESTKDSALSQRCERLHCLTLEESVKIVKEYLIAATAKDCSLMLSFRRVRHIEMVTDCSTIILESSNQAFEYKASFIDLDLKPLDKMVYYYELDQKIVKLFNAMTHAQG